MQYVSIKKEKNNTTNKIQFIVNALVFEGKNRQQRKIPHPLGHSTMNFESLDDAKRAIELAGFAYILPDGTKEINITKNNSLDDYENKILKALLDQTNDINPNIVATAINSLSEINHSQCVELYLTKLGEDNENIRNNSIEAIFKYGIEALPMLFNALKSESWVKRNSAILCLQKFSETTNAPIEKIIEALLNMLNDINPIVKCSAIKALGIAYKAYKSTNQI